MRSVHGMPCSEAGVAENSGVFPCDGFRNAYQLAFRNTQSFCVGPLCVADPDHTGHIGAQLFARTLIPGTVWWNQEDVGDDSVAWLKPRDILTDLINDPCRFVSHDKGQGRRIAKSIQQFEICAIDPAGHDANHDFVGPGLRILDLFHPQWLPEFVQHSRFHNVPRAVSALRMWSTLRRAPSSSSG